MDQTNCPLCQAKNNCMANSKEICWCNDINITQELLDLVPDQLKRKSCICHSCIEKFNAQTAINKTT
ncbi:MAG: cysteine-rich CWC family protein [Pseudomonadota bacterium]